MSSASFSLLRWLRWRHWVDSKLAFAGALCYYLALTNHWTLGRTLATVGRFFPFLCCLAAFGYACNNYFDHASDLAGGKDPPLAVPDARVRRRIIAGCLGATALALIPLAASRVCLALGVVSILLAASYSAPPFRLKVRGAAGLLCAATAQWTLPALLIAAGAADLAPGTIIMLVLSLSIGLRWVLIHQILDAPADARAGTPTFTRDRGIPVAGRLLWGLIAFELALLLVWPLVAGEAARPIGLSTAAYLLAFLIVALGCGRGGRLSTLAMFYELTPLRGLYFFWLPAAMLLALSIADRSYLLLAPVELLWRHRHLGADLLLPWRVRAFIGMALPVPPSGRLRLRERA